MCFAFLASFPGQGVLVRVYFLWLAIIGGRPFELLVPNNDVLVSSKLWLVVSGTNLVVYSSARSACWRLRVSAASCSVRTWSAW